jgi:D-glycero-D-manno-heptose 1,7-bisphosphate phosphatase
VFLDRDGVINRKPTEGVYVADWSKFEILSGVENAIAALNESSHHVIVISNQHGAALRL